MSYTAKKRDKLGKRQPEYKSYMAGFKPKRNLYLVSVAFLLNLSAYISLEGLQSSLNSSMGTMSLSAVYTALVFSSLFLAPLAVEVLGRRKAMAFGTLAYAIYTIANMYPRPYTLIPAGIILGIGSGIMWSSARVYIGTIASLHAESKGIDEGKTTGYFFGIFVAIASVSLLPGNLVAAITFLLFDTSNSTSIATGHSNETYSAFVLANCGLHDCEINLNEANNSSMETQSSTQVNGVFLILLFLGYLALNVASALILLLAVKDVSYEKSGNNDIEKAEVSDGCGNEIAAVELQPLSQKQIGSNEDEPETLENDSKSLKCNGGPVEPRRSIDKKNVVGKVLATTLFIVKNHTSKLLIILSMHVGQIQSFTLGRFTRYWLNCSLGIVSVGFILMSFGVCCFIGSTSVGFLLRWLSRSVVAIGASVMVISVSVLLLLWEPTEGNQIPLDILICSCFGLVFSTYQTLLSSSFSMLFPDDRAAALAAYTVWSALGASLFYASSFLICNRTAVFLMIAVSIVGNTLYVIAENLHEKSKSK